MRLLIACCFAFISLIPAAWAGSFETDGSYQQHRKPVMQYGTYAPSGNAPVAQPVVDPKSKRACCVSEGPPRWYVGAVGFMVFLKDVDIDKTASIPLATPRDTYSSKLGFGFGGQVGYRITPEFRGELEVTRRTNDIDKLNGVKPTLSSGTYSSQKSNYYMVNGYYDYTNETSFTPYVGAGVGMRYTRAPVYYPNASTFLKEWTIAYQFMTGISYEVATDFNPIIFNFGYRYVTGQDAETKFKTAPIKATYNNDSHNLELGGKFLF